ncbi:hypothetical protein ABVT39_004411 [Epinephelus coioides]
MHANVDPQLVKANKKISDLKEDIRWLSGELNIKSSMLTALQEEAHEQSLQITSLTAALQDTVHWDTSAWPPPSSSSTPSRWWSWVEVVGRGKRAPGCAASPPRLSLSNRYSALASDGDPDAGSGGTGTAAPFPPTGAAPAAPRLEESALASNGAVAPSPLAGGTPAATCTDGSVSSSLAPIVGRSAAAAGPNHRLPSRTSASAARRRLLKEAVRRHSGGLLSHSRVGAPPARARTTKSPHLLPPRSHSMDHPPASCESPSPHPVPLRPLFPPSTVLFGDSIIRNIHFFNATTHCFPGATVPVIFDKLPELLHSLPFSINRLIFHLGSNDTSRRQSELTKMDFVTLFNLLKNCGKSVFISGPLPTLSCGAKRFSRLLSLNSWVQTACSTYGFTFIDNFNLFWNWSSFYRADGLHLSRLGSRMLAANIQHAVQCAPCD